MTYGITARRTTPRWLLALLAALLAVPLAVLAAGPAAAHTKLVSSNPADGAALATAPTQIVLTFNEAPKEVRSVKAQDTNGPLVAVGDPVQDGTTVSVSWPQDQAPGLFRLVYVLISDDGDPVEGTLLFSYAAGAPGSAAVSGSTPATSTAATGSTMWRAWLVGVGLVALAALGVLIVSRRRHKAHEVDLTAAPDRRPNESSVV